MQGSAQAPKPRLVGYLRVSTTRQRDEGYSLEAQKDAIERYCRMRGFELVALMEEAESAVKARPVFQKVKERVLNGEADGIIVAKLDRLGRSVRDLANIAEELRKAGKQLISVGDNIDTTSPNGKLLFHILSVIAEYERELLLERTKAGRALAEKQGKICHRPRKEVDPKVLREMKEKGLSHRMMARILGISRATLLKRLDELGLR